MTGVVHQIGRDLCRSRRKSVQELLHRLVIDIPRIQLGLSVTPRRPSAFHFRDPDLVDVTRASVDQHIQLVLSWATWSRIFLFEYTSSELRYSYVF